MYHTINWCTCNILVVSVWDHSVLVCLYCNLLQFDCSSSLVSSRSLSRATCTDQPRSWILDVVPVDQFVTQKQRQYIFQILSSLIDLHCCRVLIQGLVCNQCWSLKKSFRDSWLSSKGRGSTLKFPWLQTGDIPKQCDNWQWSLTENHGKISPVSPWNSWPIFGTETNKSPRH